MIRTIKNLLKKLTSPKVKLWLIAMAIVVVVSASVMSVVMIASPIQYSTKLMPALTQVKQIEVVNPNLTSNSRKLFKNSFIDPTASPNEGAVVKDVLDLLYNAGSTTRFSQIFGGQASGSENTKYDTTSMNKSRLGSNYIGIYFQMPVYVITTTKPSDNAIVEYDPDDSASYNNSVINTIYISLDSKDSFRGQNWYICLGSTAMSSNTYINYVFNTYGNYSKLFDYVSALTDANFV